MTGLEKTLLAKVKTHPLTSRACAEEPRVLLSPHRPAGLSTSPPPPPPPQVGWWFPGSPVRAPLSTNQTNDKRLGTGMIDRSKPRPHMFGDVRPRPTCFWKVYETVGGGGGVEGVRGFWREVIGWGGGEGGTPMSSVEF